MLALCTMLRNQTGGCTQPWWTPGGMGCMYPIQYLESKQAAIGSYTWVWVYTLMA